MTGYLLDTGALLRTTWRPDELGARAREIIEAPPLPLFVHAISLFEIGLLERDLKIDLPAPAERWFDDVVNSYGLQIVELSWMDALASTRLPPHHRDPIDRMLIATAIRLDLVMLTADRIIPQYAGLATLW